MTAVSRLRPCERPDQCGGSRATGGERSRSGGAFCGGRRSFTSRLLTPETRTQKKELKFVSFASHFQPGFVSRSSADTHRELISELLRGGGGGGERCCSIRRNTSSSSSLQARGGEPLRCARSARPERHGRGVYGRCVGFSVAPSLQTWRVRDGEGAGAAGSRPHRERRLGGETVEWKEGDSGLGFRSHPSSQPPEVSSILLLLQFAFSLGVPWVLEGIPEGFPVAKPV